VAVLVKPLQVAQIDHGVRVCPRQDHRVSLPFPPHSRLPLSSFRHNSELFPLKVASKFSGSARRDRARLLGVLRGAPLCGQTLIESVVERVAIGRVLPTMRGSAFDTQ